MFHLFSLLLGRTVGATKEWAWSIPCDLRVRRQCGYFILLLFFFLQLITSPCAPVDLRSPAVNGLSILRAHPLRVLYANGSLSWAFYYLLSWLIHAYYHTTNLKIAQTKLASHKEQLRSKPTMRLLSELSSDMASSSVTFFLSHCKELAKYKI